MTTIAATDHQCNEWQRMADDAYRSGRNEFGHRFSVAAACHRNKAINIVVYDTLQMQYRRWLIGGWAEVENPT